MAIKTFRVGDRVKYTKPEVENGLMYRGYPAGSILTVNAVGISRGDGRTQTISFAEKGAGVEPVGLAWQADAFELHERIYQPGDIVRYTGGCHQFDIRGYKSGSFFTVRRFGPSEVAERRAIHGDRKFLYFEEAEGGWGTYYFDLTECVRACLTPPRQVPRIYGSWQCQHGVTHESTAGALCGLSPVGGKSCSSKLKNGHCDEVPATKDCPHKKMQMATPHSLQELARLIEQQTIHLTPMTAFIRELETKRSYNVYPRPFHFKPRGAAHPEPGDKDYVLKPGDNTVRLITPNPCVEVGGPPKLKPGCSLVVHLYGGPGSGKSTRAADLYARLKRAGVNVELVREYVKSWAWEGRQPKRYDQPRIFGKQLSYESILYGKAEVIITDSPLLMQVAYAQKYAPGRIAEGIKTLALGFYEQTVSDGHQHIHVWQPRTKPFRTEGRYETEDQARAMDGFIQTTLRELGVLPLTYYTDGELLSSILAKVPKVAGQK